MIDLDLFQYRSLVDALCYFARDLGDGERSECTPNRTALVPSDPVPLTRALVLATPGSLLAERG